MLVTLVVGTLIKQARLDDIMFNSVEGVQDSVFGTNTTSKKPADIWEIKADGAMGGLYEVTTKPIDQKRLDDCVDTLSAQKINDGIVTFICRIPEDIGQLQVKSSVLRHRGVIFQFINVKTFIIYMFSMLPLEKQVVVIKLCHSFVMGTNIRTKTKEGWSSFFGDIHTD
jgi:hypothetical protein